MIKVPKALWGKLDTFLVGRHIPRSDWPSYRKWLRFYLDFCHKYKHEYVDPANIEPFVEKLKSNRQRALQSVQAMSAVRIYQRMGRDADAERKLTKQRTVGCGYCRPPSGFWA